MVRQGAAADRTAFAKRLWRLGQGPLPGTVLVLASDEVRLRHARRLLARSPVNAALALERDAALAGADVSVWRPPTGNAVLSLRYVLDRTGARGELPEEPLLSRADLPGDLAADARRALPDSAQTGGKARPGPAGRLALALAEGHDGIAGSLRDPDLPHRQPAGGVGPDYPLCPTPGGAWPLPTKGLALLARRDRASVGVARKRWSVSPLDARAPLDWRNVSGGRSRQLLRNIDHTAAVHGFLARLSNQARTLGWEACTAGPAPPGVAPFPLRRRHCAPSTPTPSASCSRGPVTWAFFLEWERRAVRPATMAQRLAPYLRYYSSHRPTDDHGIRPAVLVVFDGDIAATHFLRLRSRRCTEPGSKCRCGCPTGRPSTPWGRWGGPGGPPAIGNRPGCFPRNKARMNR